MTSKKQQEEEARKARMLALVAGGAEHFRDAQAPPKAEPVPPAAETPAPAPEPPPPPPAKPVVRKPAPVRAAAAARREEPAPESVEEPVLGPEAEDPARYLVKRRKSLRDDPQWTGTTLYLRRETHAALQEFCRGAGLDMSRVVQFCVASQMDESKRSPVLSQHLGD